MDYQFSWDGSVFYFSPCPYFPELQEFCLSLPRVEDFDFNQDSHMLRLTTDCSSVEDKIKFDKAFRVWISLALATVGVS